MYADRLEQEKETVRTRLSGGEGGVRAAVSAGPIRNRVSFKKGGSGTTFRRLSAGDAGDDRWHHDLFDQSGGDDDDGVPPANDLRALLKAKGGKQGGKGGTLGGRGGGGVVVRGRGAVTNRSFRSDERVASGDPGGVIRIAAAAAAAAASAGGGGGGGGGRVVKQQEQQQRRLTVVVANDGSVGGGGGRRRSTVLGGVGAERGVTAMEADVTMEGGEEEQTVASFLAGLGLSKYADLFQTEEIDLHTLHRMSENDLKELGIPMGPRKKIVQANGAAL
ncbi:hypothetical protein CLOM_g2557 [Closterium sp. NIES-68]|nr:hypothetical protein CLOM_g2557 [Closterium sp. NIES-68]